MLREEWKRVVGIAAHQLEFHVLVETVEAFLAVGSARAVAAGELGDRKASGPDTEAARRRIVPEALTQPLARSLYRLLGNFGGVGIAASFELAPRHADHQPLEACL